MKTEAEIRQALRSNLDAYHRAAADAHQILGGAIPPSESDETRAFHRERESSFAWERASALAWVLEGWDCSKEPGDAE